MRFWALERFFLWSIWIQISYFHILHIHVINLYSFLYFYIRYKKHLKAMYFHRNRTLLYPSSYQGFPRNFSSFSIASVVKNATNFPNTLTKNLPFLIKMFSLFHRNSRNTFSRFSSIKMKQSRCLTSHKNVFFPQIIEISHFHYRENIQRHCIRGLHTKLVRNSKPRFMQSRWLNTFARCCIHP